MTASRPLAAASFALLALLFTGCAATGTESVADSKGEAKSDSAEAAPAGDQSKEEACEIVKTALTEIEGLAGVDTSDMNAALEAFKSAQQTVSDTAAQISNDEVKPAAEKASTAMTDYVTFVDGIIADPANADVSAMGDHLTALTEGVTELTTVCA